MFEKIALRKAWKKVNSEIQNALLGLAYIDKNLKSKNYSKELYLSDCKKLTNIVCDLMQNQQIVRSMDDVVELYSGEESSLKLNNLISDIQMIKKAVEYCKLKLDEKEGVYEPKPTFETWKQSIEFEGRPVEIPCAKRREPQKSNEYKEMQSSVLSFYSFCSNIEDHKTYLQTGKFEAL